MRLDNVSTVIEIYAPASQDIIDKLIKIIPFELPDDYINFLKQHNGFLADRVSLHPIETAIEDYEFYELEEECPGLLLIASDGGSLGVGIYSNNNTQIISTYMSDLEPDDFVNVASSFSEWLEIDCPFE